MLSDAERQSTDTCSALQMFAEAVGATLLVTPARWYTHHDLSTTGDSGAAPLWVADPLAAAGKLATRQAALFPELYRSWAAAAQHAAAGGALGLAGGLALEAAMADAARCGAVAALPGTRAVMAAGAGVAVQPTTPGAVGAACWYQPQAEASAVARAVARGVFAQAVETLRQRGEEQDEEVAALSRAQAASESAADAALDVRLDVAARTEQLRSRFALRNALARLVPPCRRDDSHAASGARQAADALEAALRSEPCLVDGARAAPDMPREPPFVLAAQHARCSCRPSDWRVQFLGTGAATPSKRRGSSCIVIHLPLLPPHLPPPQLPLPFPLPPMPFFFPSAFPGALPGALLPMFAPPGSFALPAGFPGAPHRSVAGAVAPDLARLTMLLEAGEGAWTQLVAGVGMREAQQACLRDQRAALPLTRALPRRRCSSWPVCGCRTSMQITTPVSRACSWSVPPPWLPLAQWQRRSPCSCPTM